jgi:hypothetical protein
LSVVLVGNKIEGNLVDLIMKLIGAQNELFRFPNEMKGLLTPKITF